MPRVQSLKLHTLSKIECTGVPEPDRALVLRARSARLLVGFMDRDVKRNPDAEEAPVQLLSTLRNALCRAQYLRRR